jgi:hypothetical protein
VVLTFFGIELGDWVAIIALLVSATVPSVLFLVGRSRGTRSEQFRFSLQIWDRIAAQVGIIKRYQDLDEISREREGLNLEKAVDSLRSELSFFVHLTDIGELKDRHVREYYSNPLSRILVHAVFLVKKYPDPGPLRGNIWRIIMLIEKYYELIGKTEDFKKMTEFVDERL